ncbi:MAG: peptidase S10 [Rhodanobacteraceae bacterium]|nr:MAG: peptidase S10 [Rhodanobacteraceae bacterium]
MNRVLIVAILAGLALLAPTAYATPVPATQQKTATTPVPKARKVITHGSVAIDGKRIRYTATAGTIGLRNDKNQPTGSMFYVAYTEDGARNPTKRPVTFLYNGGPGASSNWLTMSGLGPYKVNLVNGAATPPAPYSVTASHESILNVTDLVFVDAMGTGFSTIGGKGTGKMFWGVDEDVKAFGQFIQRYITQNDRWNSPLFLYGESYGTTRSAALAEYLQEQGIAVNGVVLQSSVLNYFDGSPGSDNGYIFDLPSFAAIAWYHDKIPDKPASLPAFIEQARQFADGPYAQALRQGHTLPTAQLDAMARKLHRFTGLPVGYLERANLRVTGAEFRKELMLPEREHVGRYDARYTAADANAIASRPAFDPSDQQISPALNQGYLWYLQHVLKWKTTRAYVGESFDAYKHWDWKHKQPGGFRAQPLPDVAADLAAAMRKNPYLRVLSENGYFDLATPFHATEYDLAHVTLDPALRKHIQFAYFDSGHPIYINPDSLEAMHTALDTFYRDTLAADARTAAN